jgi:hypothetical protein
MPMMPAFAAVYPTVPGGPAMRPAVDANRTREPWLATRWDDVPDRVGVGAVGRQRDGADLLGQGVQPVSADIGDRHLGAVLDQAPSGPG